jgi:hypothetical protein
MGRTNLVRAPENLSATGRATMDEATVGKPVFRVGDRLRFVSYSNDD